MPLHERGIKKQESKNQTRNKRKSPLRPEVSQQKILLSTIDALQFSGMIRTQKHWHKIGVNVWVPATISFIAVACMAGLLFGVFARAAQSPSAGKVADMVSCPNCGLTNQKSVNRNTDLSQTEFLIHIKPFVADGRKAEWQVIARVLSASPLIIEVLDTEPWGNYEPDNCGIRVIPSIDAKLRASVADLSYNELIKAKMFAAGDFKSLEVVLGDVEAISGTPIYFHNNAGKDFCANRSGRLIVYHGPIGDLVTVYNDGGIYYRNSLFRGFSQQRLSTQELSELLGAFGRSNFDQLATTIPASDKPEKSTLTLICSRFQDVSVTGHESDLAPMLRRMDGIAAKALSHAHFLLRPGKRIALAIRPWPYPGVSLDGFQERKELAIKQRMYGPQTIPGNFEEMHQQLADDFLKGLPPRVSTHRLQDDPNWYVYFAQGEKLYRVAYNSGCTPTPVCKTFETLYVHPVVKPDALLTQFKQDYQTPSGSVLGIPTGWLWPREMAPRLANVPPEGTVISNREYESHKSLYFDLLKAGRGGANFIEDGFIYENVKFCQVDPGSPTECETTP